MNFKNYKIKEILLNTEFYYKGYKFLKIEEIEWDGDVLNCVCIKEKDADRVDYTEGCVYAFSENTEIGFDIDESEPQSVGVEFKDVEPGEEFSVRGKKIGGIMIKDKIIRSHEDRIKVLSENIAGCEENVAGLKDQLTHAKNQVELLKVVKDQLLISISDIRNIFVEEENMIHEIIQILLNKKDAQRLAGDMLSYRAIGGCIDEIREKFPEPKGTKIDFVNVEPGEKFKKKTDGKIKSFVKFYRLFYFETGNAIHSYNCTTLDGNPAFLLDTAPVTVYR